MNRRTLIATCVATSVTTGCYYPQYFDVAWDEEVQLHDGSVIVVNFKFTHELSCMGSLSCRGHAWVVMHGVRSLFCSPHLPS